MELRLCVVCSLASSMTIVHGKETPSFGVADINMKRIYDDSTVFHVRAVMRIRFIGETR
jgi:hypothetical protein